MHAAARYLRLFAAFARFSLAREMAFRGNFVAKILVELLWLGIMLVFYETVFAQTETVASWSRAEYLFFVGCYFTLEGIIETFFLSNCSEFADLVRTGDLDLYLLQPIDEQFLLTLRSVDWSTVPNIVLGLSVMILALVQMGWTFDPPRVGLFIVLFGCGLVLAYGFLLILTSGALWLTRNQSLFELWWLFTSVMRYPRDLYFAGWAAPIGWFFWFAVPALLVVNVPARTMVKAIEPDAVAYTALATVVVWIVSRRFFRFALRRYRSASS
jgi:ABC-2 type transport system permease protein